MTSSFRTALAALAVIGLASAAVAQKPGAGSPMTHQHGAGGQGHQHGMTGSMPMGMNDPQHHQQMIQMMQNCSAMMSHMAVMMQTQHAPGRRPQR